MSAITMLQIGSYKLPNPNDYLCEWNDLDSENSKRTESGYMTREVIRYNVHKVSATWQNLLVDDLIKILNAVTGKSFSCTFFNPNKSGTYYSTDTMYCSSKQFTIKRVKSDNGDSLCTLSLTLIQN